MVEIPLCKGNSTILCCGGRTRTCDLQVMSLASYQLLHSAILTIKFNLCCGGRTRTCDLQVMSLASYQLLHSAILTIKFNLCCGGRTRTCDLQVMSLASYQLLHSAILTIKTYSDLQDKRPISELRLQRYNFLLKLPNISSTI